MRARAWSTLFISLALAACGGPAPEPEPAPVTAGAEEPPPPPPPPPPARVRVLHATSEPAASLVSLAFSESAEPAIADLSYRTATPYVEVPPGAHHVRVLGVPSVETGEAPELLATDTELASESTTTFLLVDAAGELSLVPAPDRTEPAPEGLSSLRFFHALGGQGPVDVCAAGAAPRDPALPVFTAAEPNSFARGDSGEWADVLPAGEVVLQLRAPNPTPCRGRVLGVVRFTPSPGALHTLVAIGRTAGRPRIERELFVCNDPPADGACAVVPISAR